MVKFKYRTCHHADSKQNSLQSWVYFGQYMRDEYKVDTSFICYKKDLYDKLIQEGFECYLRTKYIGTKISSDEQKQLKTFVEQLGIYDFREFYQTDLYMHFPNKIVRSRLIKRLYQELKFAKEIIESDFNVDFFEDWSGNEIQHYIFALIAKAKKARLIRWRESPFPDRMGFLENEMGVLRIQKAKSSCVTLNEISIIEDFKTKYFKSKKVFWRDPKDSDFKITFKEKPYKKLLSKYSWVNKLNDFQRIANKYLSNLHYSKNRNLKTIEYYYLPFHYPKDSQLVFRGKPFIDQVSFAKNIERFLPENIKLVVKEHPHARGAISYCEIKSLARSGIIVLHPWENSHDIIEGAKAVMVINSTVGLEALFHSVPVISFGENYLKGQGLVYEIESFYELFFLTRSWELKPRSDQNDFNDFLIRTLRSTISLSADKRCMQDDLNPSDMKVFADGFISYINKKIEIECE